MIIQLNYRSGLPVYRQVVDQIKAAAAAGALRRGEPLPSIRPLAEQLRVNRNTVAKAYAELENQGVIETIAGKGCFLSENHSRLTGAARQELLAAEIDEAIVQAHHLQIGKKEFLGLVHERFEAFERKKTLAAGGEGGK